MISLHSSKTLPNFKRGVRESIESSEVHERWVDIWWNILVIYFPESAGFTISSAEGRTNTPIYTRLQVAIKTGIVFLLDVYQDENAVLDAYGTVCVEVKRNLIVMHEVLEDTDDGSEATDPRNICGWGIAVGSMVQFLGVVSLLQDLNGEDVHNLRDLTIEDFGSCHPMLNLPTDQRRFSAEKEKPAGDRSVIARILGAIVELATPANAVIEEN
ncbi:hypothetical protein EJ08DRAFT_699830 [Tothia fuscella]|uniref:Uncharacterized protein n=1 Tax=Tothia fuscella TaxID=1048955 RepID=A0A9P4TV87_9PEZI|nr:hypothetical protein EJ08DRAFT_699830 [Tothia fuscella]